MKKNYVSFIIFIYFFIFYDCLKINISFLKYSDELLTLFAIPYFVFNLKRNHGLIFDRFGYVKFIVLMIIIGLASSFMYRYQPMSSSLADMYLCIKFWLAIYVGMNLFGNLDLKCYSDKIIVHIRIILIILTVLYVIDCFTGIFSSNIRYGLHVAILFYGNATTFASICGIIIFTLIIIKEKINYFSFHFFWAIILMCLTMRTKAFGVAAFFLIAYYCIYMLNKKVTYKTILYFSPLGIFIAWKQIYYYFFSKIINSSARYQLLVKSIEVANDHFPLGSGFATYGSFFSAKPYSPIYSMYNLSYIYGLTESNPNFINDSFWPIILAQFGYIGTISFIFSLCFLFKKIQKLKIIDKDGYFSAICIFGYLGISSIAESSYFNHLAIPMAVILGMLLKKCDKCKNYYVNKCN